MAILRSKPNGKTLVNFIHASKQTITIKQTQSGNSASPNSFADSGNGVGTGGSISFNPTSLKGGFDDSGSNLRPSFVGLGHELGHTKDFVTGGMNQADFGKKPKSKTTPGHEKTSIREEGKIRKEHGLTPRSNYYK